MPRKSIIVALRFIGAGLLIAASDVQASYMDWAVRENTEVFRRNLQFTATEFKGKMWIVGGEKCRTSTTCTTLWSTANGDQWESNSVPEELARRSGHATVAFKGSLYVIGGKNASGVLLRDVWKSSNGLNWTKVQTDAYFGPRQGHAVTVHAGEFWLVGGERAGTQNARTDVWTSADGVYWSEWIQAEFPTRRFHSMASHDGRLWVVGGDTWSGSAWVAATNGWNRNPYNGIWSITTYPGIDHRATQAVLSLDGELWEFGLTSEQCSGNSGTISEAYKLDAYGKWNNLPKLKRAACGEEDMSFVMGVLNHTIYKLTPFYFYRISSMEPYYSLSVLSSAGRVDFAKQSPGIPHTYPFEGNHSEDFQEGTIGTLTAIPPPGSVFAGWSGDIVSSAQGAALNITRDMTVIPIYEAAFPIVTVNVTGSGRVSPSGSVQVAHGTDAAFEIRPKAGSKLLLVTVDGVPQPLGSSLVIKNVRRNALVTVEFGGCIPLAIQPNYVKISAYDDEGGLPVTRYIVPDGFGTPAQGQLDMGAGSFLVGATLTDGAGIAVKEVKPYVASGRSGFVFDPMECEDVVVKANAYYDGSTEDRPNAEGFAYSEVRYRMDPSADASAAGVPGKGFSVEESEGGHPGKVWSFGSAGPNDFLPLSDLTPAALDARDSPSGAEYQLTVNRDPNGHFSQAITDKFGNLTASWGNPSATDASKEAVSKANYDLFGRVSEDIPPLGTAYQAKFIRTISGELTEKFTPDGGLVEYRYDALGRPRFVKSAKQREKDLSEPAKNHYLLFAFDALDRVVSVSENNGNHPFNQPEAPILPAEGDTLLRKRFLYDALTLTDLQGLGLSVPAATLTQMASEIHSLAGRMSAALAVGSGSAKTAALYSYDAVGRVSARYLVLPGNAPVQKIEYEYDLAGKVLAESYFNGYDTEGRVWVMENLKETQYDALQRVKQINIDGDRRFTFEFQPRGVIAREKLYVPGQAQALEELSYRLTLQDWVQRIATPGTSPRFKEELQYGTLYNGMIQGAEYAYQLNASNRQTPGYGYTYDGLDRLTQAGTASDPDFASYGYDAQDRLTRKKEGASDMPAYVYASGKNQVTRIPGHVYKGHPNAYVFDPDGNLVLDRSKRMTIDYDALGQAIAFRSYQNIPEATLTWEDVEANGLAARFGCVLQRTVTMAYDPFGQRVLKHVQGESGEKAVAYAGALAELVSPDGDGPWTLEAVNHWTPVGLRGRRVGNAEFTYLTDHLGSVRMGLSANGTVVEGADYTPYGMMPIPLVVGPAGVARAGYTEKELDSETGLTYFGARYLDAEVGMWTAVDPMGQYHNGYSFVGGDPINFIDRWGLEGESATPFYFPGDDLYIPSYPNQAAGMPTASNVQSNTFSSGSSGPGGGGVVYLSSFGSSGAGEATQRSAQSGQDRTTVRVAHEDELSPPDDGRVDVERQETIQKNIMMASMLLGPISTEVKGGIGGISALRAMTGRMPSAARGTTALEEGSFSIIEWKGYPAGVPKPAGPFKLIEGGKYDAARTAANKANNQLRLQQGLRGQPVDVHEIQPVKFGGSPTDPANKIILDRSLHRQQVTPWWNQLIKDLNGN